MGSTFLIVTNYRVIESALGRRIQNQFSRHTSHCQKSASPLSPGYMENRNKVLELQRIRLKLWTAPRQVIYHSNIQEVRKASPRYTEANKVCKTLG